MFTKKKASWSIDETLRATLESVQERRERIAKEAVNKAIMEE